MKNATRKFLSLAFTLAVIVGSLAGSVMTANAKSYQGSTITAGTAILIGDTLVLEKNYTIWYQDTNGSTHIKGAANAGTYTLKRGTIKDDFQTYEQSFAESNTGDKYALVSESKFLEMTMETDYSSTNGIELVSRAEGVNGGLTILTFKVHEGVLHQHNFTGYVLSTDGATITATCNANDCSLPQVNGNPTATLTISAPTQGGGAAVLSGDSDTFGVSASDVKYAQKSGSTWGEETANVPSGNGFFKASLTVNTDKIISVTYGVSAITVQSGITNGTVTAPSVATVNAVVPLTITPNVGYELDTLTVQKASGGNLTVTNNSFTMPEENVTVNATFKQIDYTISLSSDITSGSITIPDTAHYNDTVKLIVSPDEGYGIVSINIPGVNLKFVSRDVETGKEVYELTMPNNNIDVDVKFGKLMAYTVFYKETGSASSSVNCQIRVGGLTETGSMDKDAVIDNVACWSMMTDAAEGITSMTVSIDNGTSTNATNVTVGGDWTNLGDNSKQCKIVAGKISLTIVGFVSETGSFYFFVEPNNSVTAPTPAGREGYTFQYWKKGTTTCNAGDNISVKTSSESIIYNAVWKKNTYTVTFNTNDGSGQKTSQNVSYGGTVTKPADPTMDAYCFDGWVVAKAVGNLSRGQIFDFSTPITGDLELMASWHHVHSYSCYQLSDSIFDDLFEKYCTDKYLSAMHIRLCSSLDDYSFEAHKLNSNGVCACGYSKTLEYVTIHQLSDPVTETGTTQAAKDMPYTLTAPWHNSSGQFFKAWFYKSGNTFKQITTSRTLTFTVPGEIWLYPRYETKRTSAELSLTAEKYSDGLLFRLNYAVPDTWKVKDCVIRVADNNGIGYYRVEVTTKSDSFWEESLKALKNDHSQTKQISYYRREDNAIDAIGVYELWDAMYNNQAVTIEPTELYENRAKPVGETGTAYAFIPRETYGTNNDHIYYAIGYLTYVAPGGQTKVINIGPMAASYSNPGLTTVPPVK